MQVTGVHKRADEGAGVSLRRWRHRNEVQERVGTKDDEEKSEQNLDDDYGVFHRLLRELATDVHG